MPHKVQLHQKYSDKGLEVVTLCMDGKESFEQAKALVQKLDVSVTNWALAEGMSEEGYAAVGRTIEGLPALQFYDRKGRLRYHLEGLIDEAVIEGHLEELLNE